MNKKIISFLSFLFILNACSITNNIDFNNQENILSNQETFDTFGASENLVLVKFKNRVSSLFINDFLIKNNTRILKILNKINVYALEVPKNKKISDFIIELKKDSNVKYAEPNYKVYADKQNLTFTDPMLKEQYALDKVQAQKGWAIHQGSKDIKIAIVDTGVDLEHPDLKDKILNGYNSLNPQETPKDDARHGTHIAGISAAITNNGIGIAGLGVKCSIIPVKVLSKNGGSLISISEGLIWAADNGADVVNMSLGTYSENETLGEAVRYALSKGVTCVTTMGNDNIERRRYPAAYPGMIAVGSTDEKDNKSSFSNYGDWMTVSAPGSNILSTLPTYMSSNGYGNLSGTSMAAPLVTGLVALIKSQRKGISNEDIIRIIKNSSDDLGEKGYDKYFGAGRINVYKALTLSK